MKYKILFIIGLVLIIIGAVLGFYFNYNNDRDVVVKDFSNIKNFEDCKAAGYPIMESYPEQCKTPDNRTFVRIIVPEGSQFGTPVTFEINESVKFSDGLLITLLEINDSRCKQGVVCIWAGELSPLFSIVNGNVGKTSKEIRLGTTRTKQVAQNDYVFLLNNTTETTATVTITKEK